MADLCVIKILRTDAALSEESALGIRWDDFWAYAA
jgi:hypothetical protein